MEYQGQSTQQKHIISTVEQDRPLVGSGVEKTIPYLISNDFAFKAKQNGVVEKIDNKNQLAILKYEDGTKDIVELGAKLSKNSNGGFFQTQQFKMNFKEGQKFKAKEIIAHNPKFFVGNKKDDISYTVGKLAKIAITSGDFTFEDSSIITEKLSKAMATKITMKEDLILGTNANISYIVKEGQKIKTGDPLIIFENSFEDKSINDVLNKIGDEFKEEIKELSKNTLLSHYTGTVDKIIMYYNKDLEEFKGSSKTVLEKYIKDNNSKKDVITKTVGNGFNSIGSPIVDKQNTDKIKGKDVNGLMIEFYITYDDELAIGDKISFYTSLKSIISDVIKTGEEPYSEYHPDDNIDAIISPMSIVSRMTEDIYLSLFTNKCLIELKRQLKDDLKL